MLLGPADVVEPFAVIARRPRHRGADHRGHRDGRAPGDRGALEEGLVDRRRLPAGQGAARPTRSSRPARPAPRWPRRRWSWAASRACSAPRSRRCCPPRVRRACCSTSARTRTASPSTSLQFAHMGAAYAQTVLGVVAPARRAAQHRRGADQGLAARAGGARADGASRCPGSSATSRAATSRRRAPTSSSPTASPATSRSSCWRARARSCSAR